MVYDRALWHCLIHVANPTWWDETCFFFSFFEEDLVVVFVYGLKVAYVQGLFTMISQF